MEIIGHKINVDTPVYIDENGDRYIGQDAILMNPGQTFYLLMESAVDTPGQAACFWSKCEIHDVNTDDRSKSYAFYWNGKPGYRTLKMLSRKLWEVQVGNGYVDKNGFLATGRDSMAMRIEDLPDGSRRYHCTDGTRDNDFTKLVFRLVPLEGESFEFTKTPHQPK